ncbi:hypothetical protein Sya03_16330 [Spirilliplanes yamanashiensis]|uniref:Uncharacterized protein n=1 Tax=Spirilliplanes yamanashiensis TaxID=42233 RepID=A0A8J3Y5M3_9ACTN|nr:hypothetical protein Sya03_16330 [Spirilliplanes yamanashiensis]
MPGDILLATTGAGGLQGGLEVGEALQHGAPVLQMRGAPRIDGRVEDRHAAATLTNFKIHASG